MIESIINFIRRLFGADTDVTAETIGNDGSQTFTTKVLLNNCVKGYDLVDVNVVATGKETVYGVHACDTIGNGTDKAVTLSTKQKPECFHVVCYVCSCENNETLGPVSGKVVNSGDMFTTVNITDDFLGLKKITFDATVEEQKNIEHNI